MKTTIETTEGKALVTFEGALDSYIAEEVTKLEYIASSGLRLFLLLLRNTKANGCQIFIKGASSELMDIFKSTGFDRCFQFL